MSQEQGRSSSRLRYFSSATAEVLPQPGRRSGRSSLERKSGDSLQHSHGDKGRDRPRLLQPLAELRHDPFENAVPS